MNFYIINLDRDAFWRPHAAGYSPSLSEAGKYQFDFAIVRADARQRNGDEYLISAEGEPPVIICHPARAARC